VNICQNLLKICHAARFVANYLPLWNNHLSVVLSEKFASTANPEANPLDLPQDLLLFF
jgi:hypothetical protein